MISAGLAVEGHSHGLGLPGHHNPYMTYAEPWRGASTPSQPKQTEFLRPAPKPLVPPTRYNGSSSSASALNGARLVSQTHTSSSPRSCVKYFGGSGANSNANSVGPVNLIKEEAAAAAAAAAAASNEELAAATYAAAVYNRIYQQQQQQQQQPPPPFPAMPYGSTPYSSIYHQSPYMMRTSYGQPQPPPLSPLDTYNHSPPAATAISNNSSTYVSPPAPQLSPHVKPGQSVLRDKRSATTSSTTTSTSISSSGSSSNGGNFKVPSGKEGSLKHRILTRPPGESATLPTRKRLPSSATGGSSALSPPTTPTKPALNTNNNTVPGNFTKGSMIQLATGQLRRVEDMTTEDFVLSAEKSPELRLAESTVVRIAENSNTGTATITLSYNKNRTQVEFEATLEHPFFVYGQSWASCNPERTLHCYGLKVHRLQVGDILVSLTPREPKEPSISNYNSGSSGSGSISNSNSSSSSSSSSKSSPMITTTATTTAMTARQVSRINVTSTCTSSTTMTAASAAEHPSSLRHQLDKTLLPPPAPIAKTASEPLDVSCNARKRRWSAPDQICDEDEQATRRHKE